MEQYNGYQKVAYVAVSDANELVVREALRDEIERGEIETVRIDPLRGEEEYRRLINEGYGCIIARGGTYRELQEVASTVPILEERIQTADILQQVVDHYDSENGRLYVIIHRNTAYGCENLMTLSPDRIKVVRYDTMDNLRTMLNDVPEQGATVLTSGMAASLSNRSDLTFVEIHNRPHTIRVTAHTAIDLLRQIQDNISQTNLMKSVYNNIDEGILIFRPSNEIREINVQAETLLGLEHREAIGMDVYDIIPSMPPKKSDGTCSINSPTSFTEEVGNHTLNFSVYPFEYVQDEVRNMVIIQDVTRIQRAEQKIRMDLSKKGLVADHIFSDIITEEPVMKHAIDRARRVAEYEGAVLIYGESGTGKELFAQSIHNASSRRNGPFVAVNCGALTDSLLESELFGYVGGAFTGARKEGKAGLFELAHNGTIFLDEINSTSINMQTKILRVIEAGEVMRVGSDYVIPLDVRVISASNSNLEKDVAEERFRRDLLYRLNTFQVRIPPVRDRKRDIPLLFQYYLYQYANRGVRLDAQFLEEMLHHDWLGNVREIRSTALRYIAFDGDNTNGDILTPSESKEDIVKEDLIQAAATDNAAAPLVDRNEPSVPLGQLSHVVEQLVIETLEGQGLTKTEIAKAMGISRQALYKKMKNDEE